MRLRALTIAVCLSVFVCLFAQAQEAPAPATPAAPDTDRWEQLSVSFGLQSYTGDQDALAFLFAADWSEQFPRIETDLTANANLTRSGGRTVHQAEDLDWAVRWSPAKDKRRLYPMAHIWYEHDEITGLDYRGTAGVGVGAYVIEEPTRRLTLELGIGRTRENVTSNIEYNTIFFDPTFHWSINKATTLKSTTSTQFNTDVTRDVRLRNETDLSYQFTPKIGLQNSVRLTYDNHPIPGHKKTNIQATIGISFSVFTGAVPQ